MRTYAALRRENAFGSDHAAQIFGRSLIADQQNLFPFFTVLDVFGQLVQGMIDVLTAKLDIPVLSWLYHELTGEDLSFLSTWSAWSRRSRSRSSTRPPPTPRHSPRTTRSPRA